MPSFTDLRSIWDPCKFGGGSPQYRGDKSPGFQQFGSGFRQDSRQGFRQDKRYDWKEGFVVVVGGGRDSKQV